MSRYELLKKLLQERILVLDGAMGTMIQSYNLTEDDYRGELFKNHPVNLKGNNDILNLTKPEIIADIHRQYLEAGADIIETNTFNANRISQSDYKTEDYVYDINYAGAQIARKLADEFTAKNPDKPRFVAGSMGPTNKTASISPDVNNPAYRDVDFDTLKDVYKEQAIALLDGGVDILLIETVFDTLNAKAALFAIDEIMEERGERIPVMLSGTLSDTSGRTLSGQTLEAFLASTKHIDLLSIGLNCSLGAEQLYPYVKELAKEAPFFVSAHPNAGMPDEMGNYTETPAVMSKYIKQYIVDQAVNIIGGCCGTTPEHIRRFAEIAAKGKPRKVPPHKHETVLSGLEPLKISREKNFINIGERTNVAGSKKFARLIRDEKYEEALQIARQQVEAGAQILDVCMDAPMIDGPKAMRTFLNLLMSDPYVARVPIMIDSSNWETIITGLKTLQGKSIVNSISLKEGEEEFIRKAKIIKRFGAAVVVMSFDEKGQATTFERKIEIAQRAYKILTEKVNFPPEDIIIDPNVMTIGTGMKEHNNYAVDFIRAVEWIKKNLPYAKTIAGVSNLSFAFRGHKKIRQALHAVFLYHAINAGLDMGIVNTEQLVVYDQIEPELLTLAEDLVLNRRPDATERLLQYAQKHKDEEKKVVVSKQEDWRKLPVEERLKYAILNGIDAYIEQDLEEIRPKFNSALQIIETVLMEAMNKVGDLFGAGKMFLPQVIRSARVMKKAVEYLTPFIQKEQQDKSQKKKGKILMATVKGDVHDIGKNITSVVLASNNFEVIDLGVMVPSEEIIQKAKELKVDMVGLSGLITPSLDYMIEVAQLMEKEGMKIPLLIGGATTSKLHTAIKIAPNYSAPTVYVRDASESVKIASALVSDQKDEFWNKVKQDYERLRKQYQSQKQKQYVPLHIARENKFKVDWDKIPIVKPNYLGVKVFKNYPIEQLIDYIDWTFFFVNWGLKGKYPQILEHPDYGLEARKLLDNAKQMLKQIVEDELITVSSVIGLFPANSVVDDILVFDPNDFEKQIGTVYTLRQQMVDKNKDYFLSLADFIAPKDTGIQDYIGMFVTTANINYDKVPNSLLNDDYQKIMLESLANRLAEAMAEKMHLIVRKELWGYAKDENLSIKDLFDEKYQGIRPAVGYPAAPDHSEKATIFKLLDATENIGVRLTETFVMEPPASTCGYYFANPKAHYFAVGKILDDQVEDYAKRKGISYEEAIRWLKQIILE